MKALELLLNHYWITKSDNQERYYQVKDGLKECKKFIQEKLGYNLIVSPQIIKLEKITSQVEPWMGIQSFQSSIEYQMLCFVLMYLEDKEVEQQFILSDITEYIAMQFEEDLIDWNVFTTRKQLIRVIQFCLDKGMLLETDGQGDYFSQDSSIEVLYENTGISKYFLRNFGVDVMYMNTPQEFAEQQYFSMDEDRGILRRQRIYRQILMSPGVYRHDDNFEDFSYMRNYRFQIEKDFQRFLNCDFHLHKDAAFLVIEDMSRFGHIFPRPYVSDELICFCMNALSKRLKETNTELTQDELKAILKNEIIKVESLLSKTYRVRGSDYNAKDILSTLITNAFVSDKGDFVQLNPIVSKIVGIYEGSE